MGEPSKPLQTPPPLTDEETDIEELLKSSPRSPVRIPRCASCLLGSGGACHCFQAPPSRDGGAQISPRTWQLYARSSSPRERLFFETDRDPLSLDEDANDSGLEKGQKEPISVSPPSLSSIYARYASGEILLLCCFYFSGLFRR